MDLLANALNQIKMAERHGIKKVRIAPTSKLVRAVLQVLQDKGYLGEVQELDDTVGGSLDVTLNGKINECGVVKPRFAVGKKTWEKFEQRFLPSKDVGILIVSTPSGVTAHGAAKENVSGGRLLAFAY